MNIFIGADHRGFELKEKLKPWLTSQGHEVIDCGNTVYDKEDDFPDFSFAVADKVAADPKSFGVVICGSAGGVTIAANKVKAVRCVTAVNVGDVKHNRQHDDANVLAIASDFTSFEEVQKLITTFINTQFLNEERFVRRLKKIERRSL